MKYLPLLLFVLTVSLSCQSRALAVNGKTVFLNSNPLDLFNLFPRENIHVEPDTSNTIAYTIFKAGEKEGTVEKTAVITALDGKIIKIYSVRGYFSKENFYDGLVEFCKPLWVLNRENVLLTMQYVAAMENTETNDLEYRSINLKYGNKNYSLSFSKDYIMVGEEISSQPLE